MAFGCINNTIKVSKGHYFDLANPRAEDVDIESIAAALSKICRFGAHCPEFYSVAEHCYHASMLANHPLEMSVLLHDAAEAYIGDMVKPLKIMMSQYAELERKVEEAVWLAFELKGFTIGRGQEAKRCDRLVFKAEKNFFWKDDLSMWEGFDEIPDVEIDFQCWLPDAAEHMFLARYHELSAH